MAKLLCHAKLDTIINRKRVVFAKALLVDGRREAQGRTGPTAVAQGAKDARRGLVGREAKAGIVLDNGA